MKLFVKNLRIFVIAVGMVMVWRGVWGLADIYLFANNFKLSLVVSVIIGITILFLHNIKEKDISELDINIDNTK